MWIIIHPLIGGVQSKMSEVNIYRFEKNSYIGLSWQWKRGFYIFTFTQLC
jgi:hypothetical protein